MDRSSENVPTKGQKTSSVALFLVIGGILFAALVALVGIIVVYGSVDNFFQSIIEASLQNRYNRIVAGQPLWPWTFWIFFWGFVALLVFVLLVVLYLTLLERKLLGWFQARLGPNRVGPWGILQPFADMIKLLVKEDIVPRGADKWLHLIAPIFIFIPTLLAFVAIPFGAGTVELKQDLVSPTFLQMWVEWIPAEDAEEMGVPGPGYREAAIGIEESEEFHKTWWVDSELDHEPLFIPTDEDGYPIEDRYRNLDYLTLLWKPENPNDAPVYGIYYRILDLETPGRQYDVLEIKFDDVGGHKGIIELGLQGEMIDKVEEEYSTMLSQIDPDLPYDERFDFGNRPPKIYLENLFERFADAVAINNRSFSAASMTPAFGRVGGSRASWRDLYTPEWSKVFYIHGAVDRDERKANLYFFPASFDGDQATTPEYDLDVIDWKSAGASFRLQHSSDGGYLIENPDGSTSSLKNQGDSVNATIGGSPVTLTLKNSQYYTIYLMGKDLGIGIIYILAVTSLAVLGIFMAGFGSNNKWSLYGAIRSAAQLFSYEVPMTLAVLGPVLMSGTLSTVDLVESQRSTWFVIPQFLAFYVFLVCMTSEVNRNPFDLPEAESELVAGFHTEYSGLKWGFFFLAEYANMFLAAAIMTVLFFGGWKGPFEIPFLGEFISSFIWFIAKCVFWLCIFIWFRATFPRFRIDQMMDYAWKVLLPIAMLNVILTGWFTYSDWHYTIWRENNWRIWETQIKPLFTNVYTNYYAVPIIVILAILFLTDIFGLYRDRKREAEKKDSAPDE